MDKKESGKRLRNVRIRNKMSHQAMADSLGYASRSTINEIEEGINEMSYDRIVRLRNYMACPDRILASSQYVEINYQD